MAESRTIFLLFWQPHCKPRLPPNGGKIVHLSYHFFQPYYTGLAQAIEAFSTVNSRNADKLQNAINAMIALQICAFLKCRVLFILMMLWSIASGITAVVGGNAGSIVWLLVMMAIWIVLTRLVMNRMGETMIQYQIIATARVADLCGNLGEGRVRVNVGIGCFWLEISSILPGEASEASGILFNAKAA